MNIFNRPVRYIAAAVSTVILVIAVIWFNNEQTNTVGSPEQFKVLVNESIINTAKVNNVTLFDATTDEQIAPTNTAITEKMYNKLMMMKSVSPPSIAQPDPEIPTAEDEFLLAKLDVMFTDSTYLETTNLTEVMSSDEYRQLTRTGRKVFLAQLSRKMNNGELDTEQMFGKKFDQEYIDSLKNKTGLQAVTGGNL